MSDSRDSELLRHAIALAVDNVNSGTGGPFGAVIARGGEVIATGANRVTSDIDPTAHAEMVALRAAASEVNAYWLPDCTLYVSCEPCPMCMGAVYWAHLERVVFAATRDDAAAVGFDDADIYAELQRPPGERRIRVEQCPVAEQRHPFDAWERFAERVEY